MPRDNDTAKWSREEIIRIILDRESARLPLKLGGQQGVESTLYQAASRIFGTWRNAVMAAGIDMGHGQAKARWRPSKVIAAIRTLSRRKRPLRARELKSQHGSLVSAARRYFGSWSKAVVAAGVDPHKLRRFPPWTRQHIVEAILTRALKNEPLASRSVIPRSLLDAGSRIFGTWGLALSAAGLDPGRFGCRLPRCDIATANQSGLPAQGQVVGRTVDGGSQACSTDAKPVALRLSPQYRTDERIIQAIIERQREARILNATAVYRDDTRLYRAALRRFGNWRSALRAAGLNPDEFCSLRGRPANNPELGCLNGLMA